jgi:hypothetical protein
MRRKLARTLAVGTLALSIIAAVAATPVLAGDSPGIPGFIPPASGNEVGVAHHGDCFWAQEFSVSANKVTKKSMATVTNKINEAVDPTHYVWKVQDMPPKSNAVHKCSGGETVLVP